MEEPDSDFGFILQTSDSDFTLQISDFNCEYSLIGFRFSDCEYSLTGFICEYSLTGFRREYSLTGFRLWVFSHRIQTVSIPSPNSDCEYSLTANSDKTGHNKSNQTIQNQIKIETKQTQIRSDQTKLIRPIISVNQIKSNEPK
jgi:hypothetical protein